MWEKKVKMRNRDRGDRKYMEKEQEREERVGKGGNKMTARRQERKWTLIQEVDLLCESQTQILSSCQWTRDPTT